MQELAHIEKTWLPGKWAGGRGWQGWDVPDDILTDEQVLGDLGVNELGEEFIVTLVPGAIEVDMAGLSWAELNECRRASPGGTKAAKILFASVEPQGWAAVKAHSLPF